MNKGYSKKFLIAIELTLNCFVQHENSSLTFPFSAGKKLLNCYFNIGVANSNVTTFLLKRRKI